MPDRPSSTLMTPRVAGLAGIVLVSLYFTLLAIMANRDLIAGRHVLFVDELITFDGVSHLLHPENFEDFVYWLMDGGDHRYGRILWNVSALFAALPERIAGVQGQIVATRMTQFCALLAAYLILTFSMLSSWRYRVVALLLLLSIPSSHYYATMPKPEPLQLLCLAIFLWRANKSRFAFGAYWVFLGIAFGAKISILPAIPLFMALGAVVWSGSRREQGALKKPLIASGSLCAGFLIGEPLNLLSLYHHSPEPTLFYVRQTFLNTGHDSDNATISWHDWLAYLLGEYSAVPKLLLILACLASALLLAMACREAALAWRQRRRETPPASPGTLLQEYRGLILFGAGCLLVVPIMVTVKRVWGFYLHNGMVLMGLGTVAMVEASFTRARDGHGPGAGRRRAAGAVALLVPVLTLLFLAPHATRAFIDSSKRTATAEYRQKSAEYAFITSMLDNLSLRIGRPVAYIISAELYDPGSSASYEGTPFYGQFLQWDAGADVVIFYRSHAPGAELPDPASALYDGVKMERMLYSRYVAPDPGSCTDTPCYVPVNTAGSGIDDLCIFLRSDISRQIYR